MNGDLKIFKKKKEEVNAILKERGYKTYQEIFDLKPLKEVLLAHDENKEDEKNPDD